MSQGQISYEDKSAGGEDPLGKWTAADCNEVKGIVNANAVDAEPRLTKADTATQPLDNISTLINDAGYITSGLQSGDNISDLVNDALYLSSSTTGIVYVASLADLSQFLNGGAYELPSGKYVFTESVDFGTSTISLIDVDGCYFFVGTCLPLISYSGTSSFITSPVTGVIFQMSDLFVTTPSATCIDLSNGNSVILNLAVLFACQLGANVDTFEFLTLTAAPIIGCNDGIQATNVKTITARLPQFNSGADVGGCYLSVFGAASERLISSTIDSRPELTENFIKIDSSYGGDVEIGVGVHKTGGGGFFDPSGRNQTDPDIDVRSVKNVANSANFASGHFTGNSNLTTISSQGVPVKINAVWGEIASVRFSFNADGTWTYIGKEATSVSVSIVATVDVSGGGTKTVSLYIGKNGTFIPTSKGEAASSGASQIGAVALVPMVTGDTLECFVANESGTSNITVTTAAFNGGSQ